MPLACAAVIASLWLLPKASFSYEASEAIGPLRLEGIQPHMRGPVMSRNIRFPKAGWITRFSARLTDKAGAARDEFLCHGGIILSPLPASLAVPLARSGLGTVQRILVAEGQTDVDFPEGYGMRVEPGGGGGTDSTLDFMAMSEDPRADQELFFRAVYHVVDEGAGPPLTDLHAFSVTVGPSGDSTWPQPPGRRSRSKIFTVPYRMSVHYVVFHGHRYVVRFMIRDADGNKTLVSGMVESRRDGSYKLPVFSSRQGLPLEPGRRYVFDVVYDNPRHDAIPRAMGVARLFFSN